MVPASEPANWRDQSRFPTLGRNRRVSRRPWSDDRPVGSGRDHSPGRVAARNSGGWRVRVGSMGGRSARPWRSAQASVRERGGRHCHTGDSADSGLAVKQVSDTLSRGGSRERNRDRHGLLKIRELATVNSRSENCVFGPRRWCARGLPDSGHMALRAQGCQGGFTHVLRSGSARELS